MENTAKKKRIIFIVGFLMIFAGMIGALCALSGESINAYADSSNGVVNNNILEKSNFYELGEIDNSIYTIVSANCRYENTVFRNERADGYGAFLYNITEYGSQLQSYTVTINVENINATTVRIGVGSYSPLSLRYLTNYTTFTNNLVFTFTLSTTLNNAHLYFAINNGGNIKINWIKMEIGSNFTGYVPNSYSNYGYNQGENNAYFYTDKHVSYVNNPTLEVDYNTTQTKSSNTAQQTSNVYENNFIPYWFVEEQNTNIYAQRTNTNGTIENAIFIYPNTKISSVYRTSGVKGVNPIGSITENKKYLFTMIADDGLLFSTFCMNDMQTDNYYNWIETNANISEVLQEDPNLPGYNQPIYEYTNVYNGIRITSVYVEITNVETTNAFLYNINNPNLTGSAKKLYYFNVTEAKEFTGIEKNIYGAFMWQQITNNLYNQGYTSGYALGYDTGTQDNNNYMQGVVNQAYENGKQLGIDQGWIKGFDTGHDQGYSEGQAKGIKIGRQQGYSEGLEDAGTNNFGSLLSAVFNTPLTILFGSVDGDGERVGGLLNWELPLGGQTINLMNLATALLSILLLGTVIKLVLKLVA